MKYHFNPRQIFQGDLKPNYLEFKKFLLLMLSKEENTELTQNHGWYPNIFAVFLNNSYCHLESCFPPKGWIFIQDFPHSNRRKKFLWVVKWIERTST